MVTAASILKRLEALEKRNKKERELKVFVYYPERSPPFWKPEDPESWQKCHPSGKAVILTMRNCGKHGT